MSEHGPTVAAPRTIANMPRHPRVAPALDHLTGSLFSKLAGRIGALQGEVFPPHVGDSWLEPPPGARTEDILHAEHARLNCYARPHGHPDLLEAVRAYYDVDPARLLVTTGATGALDAISGALLAPGDEVLICAPYWPLIRGIVRERRGVPRELDLYLDLDRSLPPEQARAAVAARVSAAVTDRTVAIYVNTPNNPTGFVMTEPELQGLVDAARAHGLWIWSDAVYEHHAYARPEVPLRDLAPERTFEVHSFSKGWAMAGNRCGFVIGPEDKRHVGQVRKISTHTVYSAPTVSQLAGAAVLRNGEDWLAACRNAYQSAGEQAAARLGVPAPEGGTFLFLDVAEHLDERGLEGFLIDCIERNLILVPGMSCGARYTTFVRLCFTSVRPEVVLRGVDVLAGLLGR